MGDTSTWEEWRAQQKLYSDEAAAKKAKVARIKKYLDTPERRALHKRLCAEYPSIPSPLQMMALESRPFSGTPQRQFDAAKAPLFFEQIFSDLEYLYWSHRIHGVNYRGEIILKKFSSEHVPLALAWYFPDYYSVDGVLLTELERLYEASLCARAGDASALMPAAYEAVCAVDSASTAPLPIDVRNE